MGQRKIRKRDNPKNIAEVRGCDVPRGMDPDDVIPKKGKITGWDVPCGMDPDDVAEILER